MFFNWGYINGYLRGPYDVFLTLNFVILGTNESYLDVCPNGLLAHNSLESPYAFNALTLLTVNARPMSQG
jgi:hypothetical protein